MGILSLFFKSPFLISSEMQKGYSRSAEKAFGLFGKFLNGFSSSQEKGSPLRLCPGLLMQAVEDDITCHWETSLTHHQVAVNPLAGPHAAPPHRAKMRCNPPSMKSAFLSFSSTALPLAFLSVLSPPPPTIPQPVRFLQWCIMERILWNTLLQ